MSGSKAEKLTRFIDFLRTLRDDRGAMAALRRSLWFDARELGDARACRYVEPFASSETTEWRRHAYYIVAGLYALHPQEGKQTLAQALRGLWRSAGQPPSLEARFLRLLESDIDQLPGRLRGLVAWAKSKGAPLNYERLLNDLLSWGRQDRQVQQTWAREFYGDAPSPQGGQAETDAEVQA
jgi:CRISPR system Cascade subunit CasB